jgi:hypothetical protein
MTPTATNPPSENRALGREINAHHRVGSPSPGGRAVGVSFKDRLPFRLALRSDEIKKRFGVCGKLIRRPRFSPPQTRNAFARRSCSDEIVETNDDAKKSHHAHAGLQGY